MVEIGNGGGTESAANTGRHRDSLRKEKGRSQGGWHFAFLAPLFLGLGLLAGETALSITGYLFAYALLLDKRPGLLARLASLLPCAAVTLAWAVAYSVLGYGFRGSAAYLHPLNDPTGYLTQLPPRLMLLLQAQFTFIGSENFLLLPQRYIWPITLFSASLIAVVLLICR